MYSLILTDNSHRRNQALDDEVFLLMTVSTPTPTDQHTQSALTSPSHNHNNNNNNHHNNHKSISPSSENHIFSSPPNRPLSTMSAQRRVEGWYMDRNGILPTSNHSNLSSPTNQTNPVSGLATPMSPMLHGQHNHNHLTIDALGMSMSEAMIDHRSPQYSHMNANHSRLSSPSVMSSMYPSPPSTVDSGYPGGGGALGDHPQLDLTRIAGDDSHGRENAFARKQKGTSRIGTGHTLSSRPDMCISSSFPLTSSTSTTLFFLQKKTNKAIEN